VESKYRTSKTTEDCIIGVPLFVEQRLEDKDERERSKRRQNGHTLADTAHKTQARERLNTKGHNDTKEHDRLKKRGTPLGMC